MSTNQQLDALLIGALYGELSPAETLTLDAHLLANPADAGLLAQLRQVHAVVRLGGLTQSFVEPPQAVSALLLQEASRKAPKKSLVNNHNERPNWFIRFVRSMALHPGLAAAASLALVAGIGGVLFTRGQGAVQDTAPARSAVVQADSTSAGSAAASAPTLGGASPGSAPATAELARNGADGTVALDQANQGKGRDGEAANNELKQAEDDARGGKLETITANIEDPAAAATGADKGSRDGRQNTRQPGSEGKALPDAVAQAGGQSIAPKPKKALPKDYVTVSTSERQPIDGDEFRAETTNAISGGRKLDAEIADRKEVNVGPAAPTDGVAPSTDKVAKKESSGGTKSVAKPTSNAVNKPADSWAAPPVTKDSIKTPVKAPVQAPAEATVQAPAPPPNASTIATAELAWVRGEHDKLKKLVSAGKCTEAAKVGAAMAARVPEYYQQYVATDRQVQACAAYIRERRALESEKTSAGKPSKAAADAK